MSIRSFIKYMFSKVNDGGDEKPVMLSPLEEKVFNNGERLIPGVTHNMDEVVRHRSSYLFFRRIISEDLKGMNGVPSPNRVKIADLGCGVGHGCQTLSGINNSLVTGVDISPECLEYAGLKYAEENIAYVCADIGGFIREMPEFDYVVSRGVLEHIPGGLEMVLSAKWRCRLVFDVPYDEQVGNPHHLITGIREEAFSQFPDPELFYQDMAGVIYDSADKPEKPNMIICVCSHTSLPRLHDTDIKFPLPAWSEQHGQGGL